MVTTCENCGATCGPDSCIYCRGTFDKFPGSDAEMFIQWKGTDVCLDFHCECGRHSHLEGRFGYVVECIGCGALYEMGTQVKARKMEDQEAEQWRANDYIALADEYNLSGWSD